MMTIVAWIVVGLAGGALVLALVAVAELLRAIAAAPSPIWAALGLAAVAAGAAWRAGCAAGDLPYSGARHLGDDEAARGGTT